MTFTPFASTGRLRFAATLLLGTMLATAAHAETLTVTDIVPPNAPLYNLSIPTVEVTDGNLTEAQVRELFAIGSLDDLTKWSGITAASLKIPTISLTVNMPATTPGATAVDETITITDIELKDVVDGVASSTQIGGTEVLAKSVGDATPQVTFTYGKITSGRYDLGAMLAYYGIGDISGTEMKPIYEGMSVAGGKFIVGDVVKCDLGAVSVGNMFAKPAGTSLNDLVAVMGRFETAAKATPPAMPDPADIKAVVSFYTGLLTAFRSEPSHLDGINCAGTDPTTSKSFTVSSGDMDLDGFEPGIYPNISVNDFAFDGGVDGFLKFGNLTWKKMDLNGPIEALNAAATLDEAWFTANWRKLIPAMDGLSISNVTFDIPTGATPDARTKGTAGLFDITLGKYINGLPSEIAVALDDATLPLPPELSAGPAAAEIAARGITEVTSDTHVKLHWDEASNTIVVDELLSDADQFFRINVTGNIGNATPALFGSDEQAAMMAGMGLTVKDLTVDIEDRGFYGMVLAISAAQGGQPMQATRTALSGMVQGMTLAILGSDETSLAAVGELGKFLSGKNSKVSITLTAKDGAGLSLADLSALEKDPTVLAGKVTVTAVASGDPVPQVEDAPVGATPTPTDPTLSLEGQKRDLKAPAQQ